MSVLRVLHLVGSAYDDFHCDLSRLYAYDCLLATADPARYEFLIAYVTPDRMWRFPASLSLDAIAATKPMLIFEALVYIATQNIDVALPQMFCIPGMTHYRALFDVLKIPYVGNLPDVMALTAHKVRARSIVAAAGVSVPRGVVLRSRDASALSPPVVVKPVSSDNSLGVTLVNHVSEYESALNLAFNFADEVIVEDYIALGREVRCGTIDNGAGLISLPLEEYQLDCQMPIRSYANKLKRLSNGELSFSAKDGEKAWSVHSDDPITAKVQFISKQCHAALGCRDYSLFDFRIDPQGQVWFLEAGLYCSFSPKSVLVSMAAAAGIALDDFLWIFLNQAAAAQ